MIALSESLERRCQATFQRLLTADTTAVGVFVDSLQKGVDNLDAGRLTIMPAPGLVSDGRAVFVVLPTIWSCSLIRTSKVN